MADAKTDFGTNIPEKITSNPDTVKSVDAIFLFKISGDNGGTWTVNLKDDPGVKEGEHGDPDCTLEMTDEDWQGISDNPSSAMGLFFQGKLKVSGNAMLATKLQQILQ